MNSLLLEGSELLNFLKPNKDHVVLDRGFRDSVGILNKMKIDVHMPALKAANRNGEQFSVKQSNQSRKVTLVRWMVEAINGKLKMKYKFFNDVVPGSYLPKLTRFLRIAMAMINCFCPTLLHNSDRHQEIALSALEKCKLENQLQKKVIRDKLNHETSNWETASSITVQDFPRLSIGIYKHIHMYACM